jgi:signal transduction histidine kinase
MKKTALRLADGQYTAKTNIQQNDEIGELANTLDILADRLDIASHESDKLETMRRDFVANISHELRTPITVIRGSLEALIDKVVTDPSKIEEYNTQMLKESKYLERLVGDLLDLSKLQSTDFAMEKAQLSISDIIEDVKRSANHLAEKKAVKIEITKDEGNYKVTGDYGRIRQMIMIILDNAIKFSPNNQTVTIALENGKLSIKDRGIGIPQDDLPYIFERFYRARSEKSKTGTGLGLAIAKQIAERQGIELTAQSIQGQGATFIFSWDGDKYNTPQKDQA